MNIGKIFEINKELLGGVITNYLEFEKMIHKDLWKNRKLYNG
jgi:hypothetical protein